MRDVQRRLTAVAVVALVACQADDGTDEEICRRYIADAQTCVSQEFAMPGSTGGVMLCLVNPTFGTDSNEMSETWVQAVSNGCELFAYQSTPPVCSDLPCAGDPDVFRGLRDTCVVRTLVEPNAPYPECLGGDFAPAPGPPDDLFFLEFALRERCDG